MQNPIIVALDNVEKLNELRPLVEELSPHVRMFKVGLELMTRFGGPQVVDVVHKAGGNVFYDGKFDDISNTVEQATRAVVSLGVEMFNVHAQSGMPDAGRSAMEKAAAVKGKSKMLVVTVLTSLDKHSLFGSAYASRLMPYIASNHVETVRCLLDNYVVDQVLEMAVAAAQCGADGVISSPLELQALKSRRETRGLLKVTPGVRPVWAAANDQRRVMTPAEAMQQGASYLVIGRPITGACSPVQAAQKIFAEISEALEAQEAATEEMEP